MPAAKLFKEQVARFPFWAFAFNIKLHHHKAHFF
jgi:hypothetical protein